MEQYTAGILKKTHKKLLIYTTAQINLKNIMWGEKGQMQEYILYESISMMFTSKASFWDRIQNSGFLECEEHGS